MVTQTILRAVCPTGWHHTYPIKRGAHWYLSCFQSRPRHKHPHHHFQVHAGQLRLWHDSVVHTEVLVFPSQTEQSARTLTTTLKHVQELLDQHPELKRGVTVVQTWTQKVDSTEYLFTQRKTVKKEDTVVVQERVAGRQSDVIVEYDDTRDDDDVSRLRHEGHSVLADLVELSRRCSGGRRVVSYMRAVLVAEVYHLTFVAFRCCSTDMRSGGCGQSRRHSQDDAVTTKEQDALDGEPSHPPLAPTAPELEALEPTAPEPETLEPTAPEPETLEPTSPEQEDMVPREVEWEEDDPPPPYCEFVDRSGGIQRPPPYQLYEGPPPPYEDVAR